MKQQFVLDCNSAMSEAWIDVVAEMRGEGYGRYVPVQTDLTEIADLVLHDRQTAASIGAG